MVLWFHVVLCFAYSSVSQLGQCIADTLSVGMNHSKMDRVCQEKNDPKDEDLVCIKFVCNLCLDLSRSVGGH